jgi:rare lipoprotein A
MSMTPALLSKTGLTASASTRRAGLWRPGAWLLALLLAGCATGPDQPAALVSPTDSAQRFAMGHPIDAMPPIDDADIYSGSGETRGALAGSGLPPADSWVAAPPDVSKFHQVGEASWYGKKFAGRRTASGERYDMLALTAAHRTLPLSSYVRVTNPANGKSVVVRINDRGPFRGHRIIDLSLAAASALDLQGSGTGRVELQGLSSADAQAAAASQQAALPSGRAGTTTLAALVAHK